MCKETTAVELNRYKDQLNALKKDTSYDNHEEKRKTLVSFYEEKIKDFEGSVKSVQT